MGLWVQFTWSAGSWEQRWHGGVDTGGFSLTCTNHTGVWRLGLHSGMHRFVFGQLWLLWSLEFRVCSGTEKCLYENRGWGCIPYLSQSHSVPLPRSISHRVRITHGTGSGVVVHIGPKMEVGPIVSQSNCVLAPEQLEMTGLLHSNGTGVLRDRGCPSVSQPHGTTFLFPKL